VEAADHRVKFAQRRSAAFILVPSPEFVDVVAHASQLGTGQLFKKSALETELDGMMKEVAGDRHEAGHRRKPPGEVILKPGIEVPALKAIFSRGLLLFQRPLLDGAASRPQFARRPWSAKA
jgi:hypothetical protein